VLSRLGTVGLRGDPAMAARWYRVAAERGEAEADGLLARLGAPRAN
jgi:TPR repeat protein